MKFLPDDPDERWNRIILYGVVAFGVWIVFIVIGEIFGVNQDVRDDALLVGAAAGFLGLLLNQYHHGQQIEKIVDAVNHVEDDDVSLAATLRSIDAKVEALNVRLDEQAEREHPQGGPLPGGNVPTKRPPRRR